MIKADLPLIKNLISISVSCQKLIIVKQDADSKKLSSYDLLTKNAFVWKVTFLKS